MNLFSEIEKTIERGFRSATERLFGQAESGDLVTLHHALLESVEEQVQVLAHGRRVFPFPRVKVTLVAADQARRNLLAAAFGEDRRLENDIREALEGAGCQIPRAFAVEILTSARRRSAVLHRLPTRARQGRRRDAHRPPGRGEGQGRLRRVRSR
jgi:hypothetical protein